MKITRRGRVLAGGVVVLFLWASTYGMQAMNVVVLSGIIALGAGWYLVDSGDIRRVRRHAPTPVFAGEAVEIETRVDVSGALTATFEDQLPDDVDSVTATKERPIGAKPVTYMVRPTGRGIHTIGPATVRLADPFGLIEKTVETEATTTLVAYPRLLSMPGMDGRPDLLPEGAPTRDRHEFDHLREYVRGDAVRDVDWKSSAKRSGDPLIVKEFVSETEAGDVRIVAESEPGGSDAMARAAATVAVRLLDQGVAVGLETVDETLPVAGGEKQRSRVLIALARTTGGRVDHDAREETSVRIFGNADGRVRVEFGARSMDVSTATEESAATLAPLATDGGSEKS